VQPGEDVDAAADLAGLIRLLGLEQPIVGGHSMGAGVSALMAMLYPELVRALLLEDPPWRDVEPQAELPPSRRAANVDWLKRLEGKSLEELVAICEADNPGWPEIEWRPWAEGKLQLDRNFMLTENSTRRDWQDILPAIQCRILLITAETDKGAIVSESAAEEATILNPWVEVVKIGGAGHSIRRENYVDYMKAVRKFLASV
jgi:pimeloyl-ACP methyl ester carboxylesterase